MPCSNTGQFCYKDVSGMAKKEKLTDLQREYKDLANKLKRKIKDINKRGYVITMPEVKRVTKRTIDKLKEIQENIYAYAKYYDPILNKYVSGEVRRKQERIIAARKGWEKRRMNEAMRYFEEHPMTDEKFKDLVGKRREAQSGERSAKLSGIEAYPNEALEILRKVNKMIEDWQPLPEWSAWLSSLKRQDRNALKAIIDGAINEFGWKQCAKNIKAEATWFFNLSEHILYESESRKGGSSRDEIRRDLIEVATIIRGRALTVEESIDITDLEEELNEL